MQIIGKYGLWLFLLIVAPVRLDAQVESGSWVHPSIESGSWVDPNMESASWVDPSMGSGSWIDPSMGSHVLIISIDGLRADILNNSEVEIPTLRSLAANGVMAEGMQPTNPTLTWPGHTTLVTGVGAHQHHVLFNGKVMRSTDGGLPVRINSRASKSELVRAPTLYDAFFESGLRTAEINWPATRFAETIHDGFPDSPDNVGSMTDELQWDLYEAGILSDMTNFALWQHDRAGRDRIWQQAASYLIENRMPDLLLVHFLPYDSATHRYGLNSGESKLALENTDALIGDLMSSLERSGQLDRTTIFVISDHGFVDTPRTILPNLMLHYEGFLELDEDKQIIGGRAQVLATGGFGMVYFQDATDELLIEEVKELFEHHHGIEKVIAVDEFQDFGLPEPTESDQVGQLAIFARPGFALNIATEHDEIELDSAAYDFALAHHGFLNHHRQMNAVFIAWGRGIDIGKEYGIIDARTLIEWVKMSSRNL